MNGGYVGMILVSATMKSLQSWTKATYNITNVNAHTMGLAIMYVLWCMPMQHNFY